MSKREIGFIQKLLSSGFRMNGSLIYYSTKVRNLFICEIDMTEDYCNIIRTYDCDNEIDLREEGLMKFKEIIANY